MILMAEHPAFLLVLCLLQFQKEYISTKNWSPQRLFAKCLQCLTGL